MAVYHFFVFPTSVWFTGYLRTQDSSILSKRMEGTHPPEMKGFGPQEMSVSDPALYAIPAKVRGGRKIRKPHCIGEPSAIM